jgi:hypothetical protein
MRIRRKKKKKKKEKKKKRRMRRMRRRVMRRRGMIGRRGRCDSNSSTNSGSGSKKTGRECMKRR